MPIKVNCDNCGAEMLRKPCELRMYKTLYCSRECSSLGHKGFKLSKETKAQMSKSRTKAIIRRCKGCGKELMVRPCDIRNGKKKFCSVPCYSAWCDTGIRRKFRCKNTDGYYMVARLGGKCSDKIGEHRKFVSDFLARELETEECVHHINENIIDNRLENLYLFPTNEEHSRYHRLVKSGKIEPINKSNLLEIRDSESLYVK